MTSKQGRRGVTREQVLDLAATLFARNGYKATNLKLVADQLNVTRQALYYHFTSKSEILAALFDERMNELERAAQEAQPEGAETRFEAMLRAHLRRVMEDVNVTAVLVHERPEINDIPSLNAVARRQAHTRRFIEAYAEGVAAGALREIDPERAANILLAAANSVTWWYHPKRGRAREDDFEDMWTVLAGGFVLGGARRRQVSSDGQPRRPQRAPSAVDSA